MCILDRYIFKSAFTIFTSCILVFLGLYVVIDLLTQLEVILKANVAFIVIVRYYLSYLPSMFVQVAPFTCLLSTLYTFGTLNHSNEIIAMRSSGLSIIQITKTVIIFGFIISLVIFWLGDKIIPKTSALNMKLREQIEEGIKTQKVKKQEIINNLCMYGMKNRLFFINKFDTTKNTMDGITILEHDEHQNIVKKIVANRGAYKDNLWRFYQSITYKFDTNGQVIGEPDYYEEEIMSIPETPYDFISQRQRVDYMTVDQLNDYIWRLSKSGATSVIRKLKVSLYQRFFSPFTTLIIILLGIPFAFIMKRRATGLSSIGISILVGFLYYVLDAISCALGSGGALMPLLAASLSHIIAASFAIYLISTMP